MCCVFCWGDGDENSSDDDDDYSLSDQEASDSGGDAVSMANLACFISVSLDHNTKILFSSLNNYIIATFSSYTNSAPFHLSSK